MTVLTEAQGTCKTCGLWVYTIWVGDELPNGACPERKDGAPAACSEVLSSLCNARTSRQAGMPPDARSQYCETLQKALGITDATLDAWLNTDDEDTDYD